MADKKPEEELDDLLLSAPSIFLGFESETATEKVEMTAEVESEPTVTNKSAEPSVAIMESGLGPKIELLWSFQCPMTKGYNVTSIDWNKTNQVGWLHLPLFCGSEYGGSEEIHRKFLSLQSLMNDDTCGICITLKIVS